MKVYACFHQLIDLEYYDHFEPTLKFITSSESRAKDWIADDGQTREGYEHAKYYEEFNLQ